MPVETFCISCNRRWVNKCGPCDLCSIPPRRLKGSEAPLHACVHVYVSLMMEGEKESLHLLHFFSPQLPEFQQVSHRGLLCSSRERAALVFPVADSLQLSCQSERASPERQCRGDPAPGSLYASVNRTEDISFR